MPRTQPTEDATFPIYRVQAICPTCGRTGETKALRKYPEGFVIRTRCSRCVQSWEARVEQRHNQQPLGTIRSKGAREPEPERRPFEHKPDFMDKTP